MWWRNTIVLVTDTGSGQKYYDEQDGVLLAASSWELDGCVARQSGSAVAGARVARGWGEGELDDDEKVGDKHGD